MQTLCIVRTLSLATLVAATFACGAPHEKTARQSTAGKTQELAPVGQGEDVTVDRVPVDAEAEASVLDGIKAQEGSEKRFGWGGAWSVIRVVYWTYGCTQQNIREIWRNNYGYEADGARWAADQWRWHFLPVAQQINAEASNCPWPRNTYMQFVGTNNYWVGSPLCVTSRPIYDLNQVIENQCY